MRSGVGLVSWQLVSRSKLRKTLRSWPLVICKVKHKHYSIFSRSIHFKPRHLLRNWWSIWQALIRDESTFSIVLCMRSLSQRRLSRFCGCGLIMSDVSNLDAIAQRTLKEFVGCGAMLAFGWSYTQASGIITSREAVSLELGFGLTTISIS
jgi:hypothetical protein